ncbi:MAG: S9 family peptidase [Thermoleophilia bacterium]
MSGMIPDDVFALSAATDPRLSPDGTHVAYVATRIDRATNDYVGSIWIAVTDGSAAPRRLETGAGDAVAPRWSPNGARIAFTSHRDAKVRQLYVVDATGGEPKRLTDLTEDVTDAVWSPDGAALAFVSRVRDADYDESDERRRRPRRFTRLQYKLEHVGWTADRPAHVFIVSAEGSAPPRQLTSGDFEDACPAWSPDGARIAFVSARHPFWDTEIVRDIYVVAATGGEPHRLTDGRGAIDLVSWSADGSWLAAQYFPGVFDDPRHGQIALVDAQSGVMHTVTASLDRNCAPYPPLREPVWDGDGVVFAVEDAGVTHLYRATRTEQPRLVVGGVPTVTGFDVRAGSIVHTASSPTRPSEVYNGARRLSDVAHEFVAQRELVAPERFTAVSTGGAEVEAWVMRPADFVPGRRYPMLLNIHGGPFSQYDSAFFDEFQVYAGAGYVVVYANPRGSSGYSEAWGRAIRGDGSEGTGWGSVDYDDCMAVVDEALRRFEFIDPERLGVMGGSYGGFMTSWIVAHTTRFQAAVSERAVNQFVSQWGSSDMGWDLKGYTGAFLYEDPQTYLRLSPATYAAAIETPLLILHSEDDLRCPVEQAEQLFVTLRLLRKPVELVRFPKESHELTRSGSPVHRVQRFEIVLEWFERYLKRRPPSD